MHSKKHSSNGNEALVDPFQRKARKEKNRKNTRPVIEDDPYNDLVGRTPAKWINDEEIEYDFSNYDTGEI